ncbi:MAG: hypothetical protein LBU34_01920 [Planctomycetaceae bacterium]|nr:hypothetical protein [Planctomycetaceae bacterium]
MINNSQGRQPLAVAVASVSADNEFMSCWLFGLPTGKRPFGERLSPTVAYLMNAYAHHTPSGVKTIFYNVFSTNMLALTGNC